MPRAVKAAHRMRAVLAVYLTVFLAREKKYRHMALTDLTARKAKPTTKPRKISDEKGLYLLVNQTGKYWRFDYRFAGRRKTLALGVFDAVGLRKARDRRDDARKLVANGIDPSLQRKLAKTGSAERAGNSFEAIAREWFAKYSSGWVPSHAGRILRRLERDVFPWIGGAPVTQLTAKDVLTTLRRIEKRGAVETAHRASQNCRQVFRYAIATGRAEQDPTVALRGALAPSKAEHHASITDPKKIGALLRALDGYEGSLVTRSALQLAPLVFVRPGELRQARWSEFNIDAREWRIPAERMKMRSPHLVPLSNQAVVVLRELFPLTGQEAFLFPGARSAKRPMSENTVNAALRRLGYGSGDMTGHGFRSMASTLLNEQGWNRDAIERQLAHTERNGVRAAYNYAEHLPERGRMMQAWADYLDKLKKIPNPESIGLAA